MERDFDVLWRRILLTMDLKGLTDSMKRLILFFKQSSISAVQILW